MKLSTWKAFERLVRELAIDNDDIHLHQASRRTTSGCRFQKSKRTSGA